MRSLVIDASVVIKWIIRKDEKGVTQARKIYDLLAQKQLDLYAPVFLLIEVTNILFKKKKLKSEKVILAYDWLRKCGIKFINPSLRELREYIEVSVNKGFTIYDGQYVGLSRRLGYELLTYDQFMLDASGIGIKVEDVVKDVIE